MGGLENCDPVMLDLFRAEMDAHLPALSGGLLALEKGRAEPKDLEAMMRAAHSIKGAARIVGIQTAVQLAHAMEDCFSAAQGQRLALTSESVDVLLQGVDTLGRICSPDPEAAMADSTVQRAIERIESLRAGRPAAPSAAAVQPTASQPAQGPINDPSIESPTRCVVLPAVLDDGAAQSLRTGILDVLHQHPACVELSFSAVTHVSAAALALLASVARECRQNRTPLVIHAEGAAPSVAALLHVTGLDKSFRTTPHGH